MSTFVKTVLVAATLALTPYAGGASSLAQAAAPQVQTAAHTAAASPWAVFGLAVSVMVLGAIRRR